MKKTIFIILFSTILMPFWAQKSNYRLLVGTYTNTHESEGIYIYNVDMKKGQISQKSIT